MVVADYSDYWRNIYSTWCRIEIGEHCGKETVPLVVVIVILCLFFQLCYCNFRHVTCLSLSAVRRFLSPFKYLAVETVLFPKSSGYLSTDTFAEGLYRRQSQHSSMWVDKPFRTSADTDVQSELE
jgi:hypothetical protein